MPEMICWKYLRACSMTIAALNPHPACIHSLRRPWAAMQTSNYLLRFNTAYTTMLDDVLEQLAARHVLHDHEDVAWSADHLISASWWISAAVHTQALSSQPYDVRVFKEWQILNLASNFADDIKRFDLLPVEHLYSHLVARFVNANCSIQLFGSTLKESKPLTLPNVPRPSVSLST